MKKIKYIFLSVTICIASIALVLQSCNKSNNDLSLSNANKIEKTVQYKYLDVSEKFKQVAQFHNDCLESVYNDIQNAKNLKSNSVNLSSQNAKSNESIKLLMLNSIKKYCAISKVIDATSSGRQNVSNYFVKKELDKLKSNSIVEVGNSSNSVHKEFMDRIHLVIKINCNNKNISALKEQLTKIDNEIDTKLSKEDAESIHFAISVAYASTQYWQNNYKKWSIALGRNNVGKTTRYKFKTVSAESYYTDNIYPVIIADCDGADVAVLAAATHALYIAAASGGTAVVLSLADFLIEIGIGATLSSGYKIYQLATGN